MALSTLKLEDVKKFIFFSYENLKANEREINDLNVFPVPDGDTGTNMLLTMSSVVAAVESESIRSLSELSELATKAALLGARGNSGVILSQIIKGFFLPVKEVDPSEIDPKLLIKCIDSAGKTAYKAVKKPVEGTMLTVIRYAAEAVSRLRKKRNLTLSDVASEAYSSASLALQKTPEMLEVLREAGVIDAGGLGLLQLFDALKLVVEEKPGRALFKKEQQGFQTAFSTIPSEEITFQFCTEFLIKSDTLDVDSTNEFLSSYGDSILVIKDGDIAKIHIHTDKPIELLNLFKNFGEFIDIKVNNMKVQTEEANKARKEKKERKLEKEIAIVAVAQGDGIVSVFKSLGADEIIEGGQSMNPSSEQILKAIEDAPSSNVIVLPNNKNIILACEQAALLTDKNVKIVPSQSLQQGLQALLSFNPELDLNENLKRMEAALKEVVSVALTRAVKNSSVNGLTIEKGDYLGILDGKIVESGKDLALVLVKTFEKAGVENASFVTIFLGKDITPEESELVSSIVNNNFKEVEFEVKYGGQDHYQILAAIER